MPLSVLALPTAAAFLLLASGSSAAPSARGTKTGPSSALAREGAPRTALVAGFVAALVLLATVTWLDWRHSNRVQLTLAWVARTVEVQALLYRLLAVAEDIETGASGGGGARSNALQPARGARIAVRAASDGFRAPKWA